MDVATYHNPACGTSRNTLALIRNAGLEPHVVEDLKTPPSRAVMRQKGTPCAELGLDDPSLTDEELLDAVLAHPILINRPIVVTPQGVRLCRPSEEVIGLSPPQPGEFVKEDGERVVGRDGCLVATA